MWIGHVWFLSNVIFALVFYKERIAAMDSSAYMVNIISNEGFHFAHMRYGAMFGQLLPIAAIALGLSLKTVMLAYSLNLALIGYACWAISWYLFRDKEGAVAIILITAIGITHLFFWPVSELYQCMIYSGLLFAWLKSFDDKGTIKFIIVAALLSLLVITTHPLGIISLPFAFALFLVANRNFWQNRSILITIGSSAIVALVFLLVKGNEGYDANKTAAAYDIFNSMNGFWDFPGLPTTFKKLRGDQLMVSLISIVVLIFLLAEKKFIQSALLILACIGYFIIFTVSYPDGESFLVRENMMLPFTFFAVISGIPAFTWLQKRKLLWPILTITLILSAIRIQNVVDKKVSRINWHETMFSNLSSFPERKFIFEKSHVPGDIVPINWALYSESLLISALHGKDSTHVLFAADDPDEFIMKVRNQELRYPRTPWWTSDPIVNLGDQYFSLPASKFRLVNTVQEERVDIDFEKISVALDIDSIKLHVKEFPDLRVRISNGTGEVIRSTGNTPGISYKLWQGKLKIKTPDIYIPMSVDLGTELTQLVRFKHHPHWPGPFKFQFGLKYAGEDTLYCLSDTISLTLVK